MKLNDFLAVLADKKTPICVSVMADNGDSHVVYDAITAESLLVYSFLFDGNDYVKKVSVVDGGLVIYLGGEK